MALRRRRPVLVVLWLGLLLLSAIGLFASSMEKWGTRPVGYNSGLFYRNQTYGEPIPWEKARVLFPRYTMAVIIDVETGERFEVERRAGDYHADVQPLTVKDTNVIKKLYPDGWSWKRRAVVVEIGQFRIAASMHGMPHGPSKIRGNDVRGHFCLHFLGSRGHASGKVDAAHQLMVWKAAGQPEHQFLEATPEEVIWLFMLALEQGDPGLAALGTDKGGEADIWLVQRHSLGRLPAVALRKISPVKNLSGEYKKTFQVEVTLQPSGQRSSNKTGALVMHKDSVSGRWLIEGEGLRKLLE